MVWDGEDGVLCTEDEYSWCATAVSDTDGSYTAYGYCGFGYMDQDTCVPMIYSGVSYDACTEDSTNGWCATATYMGLQYANYKYCTEADWTVSSSSDSSDSDASGSQTAITGENCVPMTYRLALFISICHSFTAPLISVKG